TIAPQKQQVVLDQGRRAERHATRDAIDLPRLLLVAAGTDRHHLLAYTQPSAHPQDKVARHDRGANSRLDVTLVEDIRLPVLATGLRVNARDTVVPVGEDHLGGPAARLEDTRGRVSRLALARDLPALLAGRPVEGDQRTRSVLIVGDEDEAVVD